MSVPFSEKIAWLRAEITHRKAVAEKATEGPWVDLGPDGEGDAHQIHGAPSDDPTDLVWDEDRQDLVPGLRPIATLRHDDGGGVWREEDAEHIVLNQPEQIIRDCDKDLALLDAYVGYYLDADDEHLPVPVVTILAKAYGYSEERAEAMQAARERARVRWAEIEPLID
jgi:hypothetical protein